MVPPHQKPQKGQKSKIMSFSRKSLKIKGHRIIQPPMTHRPMGPMGPTPPVPPWTAPNSSHRASATCLWCRWRPARETSYVSGFRGKLHTPEKKQMPHQRCTTKHDFNSIWELEVKGGFFCASNFFFWNMPPGYSWRKTQTAQTNPKRSSALLPRRMKRLWLLLWKATFFATKKDMAFRNPMNWRQDMLERK